jgi:hypothetical protein
VALPTIVIAGVSGVVAFLALAVRERRRMEPAFRRFRTLLEHGTYEIAGERSGVAEILRAGAHQEAELVALGFRPVVDLIFSAPDFPMRVALRGFVDSTGTVAAHLMRAAHRSAAPSVELESWTRDDSYATARKRPVDFSLPQPPCFHHTTAEAAISTPDMLALHRQRLPRDAALVSIAGGEELHQQIVRMRALDVAWRASLDPDELLDIDLRACLGSRYAKFGPRLKRRVLATESARRRPAPAAR